MPSFPDARAKVLPWLALVTVWILWGSTYLGIRAAVETIPPLLMAGTRHLTAGALLYLVVCIRHGRDERRVSWRHLRSAMIVGGLMLAGGNGLVGVGEKKLPSGLAALIVAAVPAWMVLMHALATRTRVAARVIVALALGMIGVGILVGGPGSQLDVGSAVIVLIASVLWAGGSVYARTAPLPRQLLLATSLEMLAGGLMLLVAGAATGELSELSLAAISARSAVGLAWLIVCGSMVAFTAYIYANGILPNETVATYAYVNPVVAVVLGALVDGEPVTLNILLGGAAIVASVAVIVRSRATRAAR